MFFLLLFFSLFFFFFFFCCCIFVSSFFSIFIFLFIYLFIIIIIIIIISLTGSSIYSWAHTPAIFRQREEQRVSCYLSIFRDYREYCRHRGANKCRSFYRITILHILLKSKPRRAHVNDPTSHPTYGQTDILLYCFQIATI